MQEKIYTIPVTEAFSKKSGCPFCALKNKLEDDERELIMGASMMEPDIRIKTNALGFCKRHFDKMLTMLTPGLRKNLVCCQRSTKT